MTNAGHLFIVSGPSGAGKSTILREVRKNRPELKYSVSYTTRSPRDGEQEGVHYHFIREPAFREKIETGELAEWAEVHGCLYGTSATFIEESRSRGDSVLLDIDVQGAEMLRIRFPDAITIFIMPPGMKELERRLRKRGSDVPEAMQRRLGNARAEMGRADRYDYVIVNDNLAKAVEKLESIIDEISAHR